MGPFHMSKVTKYKLIPSEMVAFELSSGNKSLNSSVKFQFV